MAEGTVRLLMVDDDEEDVEIVRDLLQAGGASGVELIWASGYEQGMDLLRRGGFDVCLVDYRLGPRDGIEFLMEAGRVAPRTPLILLTGLGGAEVDRRALEAGASDYIPKGDLSPARLERSVRYAAERKRRFRAESRFRALIENSHDLIWIVDADGSVAYVSPSVRAILGLDPEDVVGRIALTQVHPGDRARVEGALALILAESRASTQVRYRARHADGSWRTLDAAISNHVSDPAIGGLVINSRDITGQLESEARVRFQSDLLDAVGQAVIAVDADGAIVYWNRAAESIYGWTPDEALGRSAMDLMIPEESRAKAEEIRASVGRGEIWTGEVVLHRKDGASFPALVSDSPIRDEEGRVVGAIGVSTDLTDLKRTEADLRERVKELRTLYRATRALTHHHVPLEDRLQELVELIPSGWLHPEVTEARLVLGETTLTTAGFRETPWMQASPVAVDGVRGRLEVALSEARPERDEGPFLSEERELLDSLAAAVAEALERQRISHLHERTVASLEEAVFVGIPGPQGLRIGSANPAAVRMFGYEAEELIGSSFHMLHEEVEDARRFEASLMAALSSGAAFHERQPLCRRDGTVFQAEQAITLLEPRLGVTGGIVAVVRDVSEGVRAEDELRRSEERFRQITEHVHDVFWIRSAEDGALEYVSPAWDDVWGFSARELYQEPERWERTILPSDRARLEDVRADRPLRQYEEEYRIVRPDGEVRWIWERAFPVEDGRGGVSHLIGVSEDVTERRRVEERFRVLSHQISDMLYVVAPDGTVTFSTPSVASTGYAREEFEGTPVFDIVHAEDRQMVRRRFDELVARPGATDRFQYRIVTEGGSVRHVESVARNLLDEPSIEGIVISSRDITERVELEERLRQSQKMEAIGRLAGGIAHDFNNLLTVIRSQTDLLLLDLEPSDAVAGEVEAIQDAADRAARLTSQLLAFSRYQVLRPRVVDLSAIVRGVSRLLDRIIGEDVQVVYDLPEGLPPVEVDPVQLEQVVLNLAVNSRDAMPDGGTLTFSTWREDEAGDAAPESEEEPRTRVVLRVEDTGIGMDDETRERVFEPFFTTKPTGRGTGLGLSMVYGVVQQSGGTVEIASEPDVGTTFVLRFPAAEGPPEARVVAAGPRAPGPGEVTGRVLVVEDNEDVRRAIRRILERGGLEVEAVEDAEEGLARLEGGADVGLVLTDLVLPRMSGRTLVDVVRRTRPALPMIVMSGYHGGEPGDRRDLPRDVAFIQKPFAPDELLDLVREALAGG